MKIYMAALHTNGYKHSNIYQRLTPSEQQVIHAVPHILESYHYIHRPQYVDAIRNEGDKIFLDSGAFSAHTMGVEIDMSAYCNYIKRNIDIIRHEDGVMLASVLDGIGDVHKTYENQLAMEAQGVRPLPCFHFGEDERYLEWYIANYEYITIGGLVPVSNKAKEVWLDRIWEQYLTDGAGRPKLKVHGFGLTSLPLMKKYPWYSVDSSRWIQLTSFGQVITPEGKIIHLSEKSPRAKVEGEHLFTVSDLEKSQMSAYIRNYGFDPERLSKFYESRAAFNLKAFVDMDIIFNKKEEVFKGEIQELF